MGSHEPFAEFRWLDNLRLLLRGLKASHSKSLDQFQHIDTGGFLHFRGSRRRMSRASTAVAVMSLTATGEWPSDPQRSKRIVNELLNDPSRGVSERWFREGLGKDNVFTVGFVLEAATELFQFVPPRFRDPTWPGLLRKAEDVLLGHISDGNAQIQNYPPSAYMTQLAVRVLLRRRKLRLTSKIAADVRDWAWTEVASQLALTLSKSKLADVFELGYAILICVALEDVETMVPERSLLLQTGLEYFFAAQLEDGTWPRGRPRFPDLTVGGSGFSYDYELLAQMLQALPLRSYLLSYLAHFERAARALLKSRLPLSEGGWGWTSGNYLLRSAPESWTTASAYHFAHALDRLLAERIRHVVFSYVGAPPPSPEPLKLPNTFAEGFLDCPLQVNGTRSSLRSSLAHSFAEPLREADRDLRRGIPLPKTTPMSAIFFGPPGTSKTSLAKMIAKYLGWPLLSIDPSHLFRQGADMMQAEADRIFTMLAAVERVVVLLDEFDEMGRDRQSSTEMTSRILTTLMLPKFTNINDSRRIVFIVATNYIDSFDVAIRRPGRFDLLVQVLPPSADAKLESDIVKSRKNVGLLLQTLAGDSHYRAMLEELTFSEFESLITTLPAGVRAAQLRLALETAHKECTMETLYERGNSVPSNATWRLISESQQVRTRLLPLR